jgi:hypothetical protein
MKNAGFRFIMIAAFLSVPAIFAQDTIWTIPDKITLGSFMLNSPFKSMNRFVFYPQIDTSVAQRLVMGGLQNITNGRYPVLGVST